MAIRNKRQLKGAQINWGNLCQATQKFSESVRASRALEIQEQVSLHSFFVPFCVSASLSLFADSLSLLSQTRETIVTLQPHVQVLNFSSSSKERHTVSISPKSVLEKELN